MSITKKLLAGAILISFFAAPAYAGGIDVQLNIGEPAPVYVPPPVIYTPSPAYVVAPWGEAYDPHHRRHDWEYWHHHHHDHDHWDHDHDHDRWDHDRR